MNQKNQRLIDELNKLIRNILSKHGEVYLPSIGSLKIVANKEGEGQSIRFTTKECDRSVVKVIAKRGNCTIEQAERVYNKWVAEVKEGDSITIAEIGVIEGEQFTPHSEVTVKEEAKVEAAVEPKIEPQPKVEPKSCRVDNKRCRDKILLSVAIVAVVSLFIIVSRCGGKDDTASASYEEEVIVEVVEQTIVEEQIVEEQEVEPIVSPEPEIKETKLKSSARFAPAAEAIEQFNATSSEEGAGKRYRVVCGVLLSRVNVGRLLLDIERLSGESQITPSIYTRNGGYMVTIFESDRFRPCVEFIQENSSMLYDSMWIYDDVKMQ